MGENIKKIREKVERIVEEELAKRFHSNPDYEFSFEVPGGLMKADLLNHMFYFLVDGFEGGSEMKDFPNAREFVRAVESAIDRKAEGNASELKSSFRKQFKKVANEQLSEKKLKEDAFDEFEDGFDDALKTIANGIEDVEDVQQEGIGVGLTALAIGSVLSSPFVVEALGHIFKAGEKLVKKLTGGSMQITKSVGEKIIKWAEHKHHVLLKPFKFLANRLSKNEKTRQEIAELFFYLAIGGTVLIGLMDSDTHQALIDSSPIFASAYKLYKGASFGKKIVGSTELAVYAARVLKTKIKKKEK